MKNIISRGYNHIVYMVVHWLLRFNLGKNVGKFKVGDLVTYNWKAKSHIKSIYEEERKKGIKKITGSKPSSGYTPIYTYINLSDETEDFSAAFWLRKCYWWERYLTVDQVPQGNLIASEIWKVIRMI